MKAVIIPIASLFLLSGCVEDDNTLVYDIECQGKSDGWHTTSNTISAADKSSYQFEGEWYCKNQVLWYSQEAGKVNLFGDFLVTKTDSGNATSKFRYSFIQRDKAQTLIVQQEGVNDNNNKVVESLDASFKFTTSAGILSQVFTMAPYTTNSYSIEYNEISENIASLSKSIFKSTSNNIYRTGTTQCAASNNQNWKCENWDTYTANDQIVQDIVQGSDTEKTISLTPDISKISTPLTTRDELERLVDKLLAVQ